MTLALYFVSDPAYSVDPCIYLWTLKPTIWTYFNRIVQTLPILSIIMAICINCNILLRHPHQLHEYHVINLSPDLISITEEWCGREISDTDRLCQECVQLILREGANRIEFPNEDRQSGRQYGHMCVCICCGFSLERRSGRHRYQLTQGSEERSYVENQIFPRQVPEEAYVCRACWMRAHRNIAITIPEATATWLQPNEEEGNSSLANHSGPVPTSETNSWNDVPIMQNEVPNRDIILNNYSRTSDTSNRCFVPDCDNVERLRVPNYMKRAILKDYKIYITPNSRICQNHTMMYNWDILEEHQFISRFSPTHIEQMLNLVVRAPALSILNFENVQNTSDSLCHYWTGLTVLKFLALFNSVPQLDTLCKKAKTALGMYLIKLRTGESMARIASLFLLSKGTVSLYINKVRNCLTEHYVPVHLGINHMSREGHSARNLLIPQRLFGTQGNNPIVICDGTYVYIQKSSNYFFQKKTWSLHKYQNLVKPFLMVACDGHIIDAMGPYAATQSDADIMKLLFQNPESPLRAYFRQNDVFILDRGFRDAIGLLNNLGYSVHKPESLEVGETQLSTLKANKSRCVTLCRWVVEVVNGRFKRDFKLLRNKYFNIYSKNLMLDFRIAAAILNNFHPLIADHEDAHIMVERALTRLEMPNLLAEQVINERINRDRHNFENVNAQLPQLHVFPVMDMKDLTLFSLGIYQIKQARSYYGEHIRENGMFKIEVDTNLTRFPENKLLIRGKIKSRHVSNKQYYTYILLNLNGTDWCQRIDQYYCSCIIGKRTVGCCAHIMTFVWYLGWARHQDVIISPPATFLDYILVREDDNENE